MTASRWGNFRDIRILHVPSDFQFIHKTFKPFFDEDLRNELIRKYNLAITTDNKPFRHLITMLPFPVAYYLFYIFLFVTFLIIIFFSRHKITAGKGKMMFLSGIFGCATFSLQYLLFYKTAAFINMNLIHFSVFLIIPLFFSSVGGHISLLLTEKELKVITFALVIVGIILSMVNVFQSSWMLIFSLIAVVFVYSGFLFPLVLNTSSSTLERSMMYAINMFCGGLAYLIIISLHALLGWMISFWIIIVIMIVSFYSLLRKTSAIYSLGA